MQIYWRESAKEQRINLIDYILENGGSIETAITVDESIENHVDRLEDHPKLGSKGRRRDTYELVNPDYGYVVAYKLETKRIVILSVLRGQQIREPKP